MMPNQDGNSIWLNSPHCFSLASNAAPIPATGKITLTNAVLNMLIPILLIHLRMRGIASLRRGKDHSRQINSMKIVKNAPSLKKASESAIKLFTLRGFSG